MIQRKFNFSSATVHFQYTFRRWPSDKIGFGAGRFQVRNPIPLTIHHVWGLLHSKSYIVAKRPPVGVAWKFEGGCQLNCRPRHLTMVQNYEVSPKIALVLLQNGMLL
ncbi:hypothetical protein AVEN_46944-1 [Araneus ventricosus]|uniref:Uncharacterized protein n=1 Tax=Araneus ventricosus TaxID=182803 RepID=A0A4Y2FJI0_ARAVE|nr:hypothetical protein AVEN_46944-1 [Araneus ventricosus]